jgi:thioesterase domain-containing protein
MPSHQLANGLNTLELDQLLIPAKDRDLKPELTCSFISEDEIHHFPTKKPDFSNPNGENDLSYIMSSSGSTGDRKWIPIKGAGLQYWADVEKELFTVGRVLSTRSPAFDARISEYVRSFAGQGTLYLMTAEERKDIRCVFKKCRELKINTVLMVPSQLDSQFIFKELPLLKNSLSHFITTGEACTWQLAQVCLDADISLWNAYGPTEATFGISLIEVTAFLKEGYDINQAVPIGLPVTPVEIEINKENRLLIHSRYLAPCYITSQGNIPLNSPFDTGDFFSACENYLLYQGRAGLSEHVKISGVKVYPGYVEEIINRFPDIQAAVVVKVWRGRKRLIAYIEKNDCINQEIFAEYLENNLQRAETPVCLSISTLPRLIPSEKIARKTLISRIDEPDDLFFLRSNTRFISKNNTLLEIICAIWSEQFGFTVMPDDDFLHLGGDSITAKEIIADIRETLHSDYQYHDFISLSPLTPTALTNQLQHQLSQNSLPSASLLAKVPNEENIFLLPPLLGEGYFTYRNIAVTYANLLNKNVIGLSSRALENDSYMPASLEEEAYQFYLAIKNYQPEGPYYLSGFSFGCLLALLVSQLFLQSGDAVAYLDLIDGFPPAPLQRMSSNSHVILLHSLLQFLVHVINRKADEEQLLLPTLEELKYFEYPTEIATYTLVHHNQRFLLDKISLVEQAFDNLYNQAVKDESKRMIALAKQHILFMLIESVPATLISDVIPRVYQSRTDQDYWETTFQANGLPVSGDPSHRFLFWNDYFSQLRRNGVEPEASHLDLLAKDTAVFSNYYERIKFKEFNNLTGFGPDPMYLISENKKNLICHVCFIPKVHLSLIECSLFKMGIRPEKQEYSVNKNLFDQNDAFYEALSSLHFSIPEQKENAVQRLLNTFGIKQSRGKIKNYLSLSLPRKPKGIYFKVIYSENERLTPYSNLNNARFFKKAPFLKNREVQYTQKQLLQKMSVLDFYFDLSQLSSQNDFVLDYPDLFRIAYHDSYPNIICFELMLTGNKYNLDCKQIIELASPGIADFIAKLHLASTQSISYKPQSYKQLLTIETSGNIPYYPTLPGCDENLQYISKTEFFERFGIRYDEGLWIKHGAAQRLTYDPLQLAIDGLISGISQEALQEQLVALINNINESMLALTFMGESIGFGVFARQDIPKHTLVCIYSGEVQSGRQVDHNLNTHDYVFYTGNFRVVAEYFRGMASFMRHLPEDKELFAEDKDQYASTNVMPEFIVVNEIPMIVLVSLRDIKQHEQIGFSFGADYWKQRGSPLFFNRNGEVIAKPNEGSSVRMAFS